MTWGAVAYLWKWVLAWMVLLGAGVAAAFFGDDDDDPMGGTPA